MTEEMPKTKKKRDRLKGQRRRRNKRAQQRINEAMMDDTGQDFELLDTIAGDMPDGAYFATMDYLGGEW